MRRWLVRYAASLSFALLIALLVILIYDWRMSDVVEWNDVRSKGDEHVVDELRVEIRRGWIWVIYYRNETHDNSAFRQSMMGNAGQPPHHYHQRWDTELPADSRKNWLGFFYAAYPANATSQMPFERSWELSAPFWPPAIAFAIVSMWLGRKLYRDRQIRRQGLCRRCGYDLRASTGRCPECGTEIVVVAEPANADVPAVHPTWAMRLTPPVAAGMSLMAMFMLAHWASRAVTACSQRHWVPYEATDTYVSAIEGHNVEAAEAALRAGADVQGRPYNTATETMDGVLRANDRPMLQMLIRHGFSLAGEKQSYYLLPSPQYGEPTSQKREALKTLELLLLCGANPNPPSPAADSTLLAYAVSAGEVKAARLLLKAGADINMPDGRGRTALHVLLELLPNDAEASAMLAMLLRFHPVLDTRDNEGNTPLHKVAEDAALECICKLVTAGADTSIKNAAGQTPIDMLNQERWPEAAEFLRGVRPMK